MILRMPIVQRSSGHPGDRWVWKLPGCAAANGPAIGAGCDLTFAEGRIDAAGALGWGLVFKVESDEVLSARARSSHADCGQSLWRGRVRR